MISPCVGFVIGYLRNWPQLVSMADRPYVVLHKSLHQQHSAVPINLNQGSCWYDTDFHPTHWRPACGVVL